MHVYPIYVPDLSDRQEDIPNLANHFLHHYAEKQNKKAKNFHEEVIDFMKQRSWNGNVRELENFIERIVTVTPPDTSLIDPSFFPTELQDEMKYFRMKIQTSQRSIPLKDQINKYEAEIIKRTLIDCGWNQSEAARKLHTSESNIRYKMSQFNIQKDEKL